jgi:hypothetical protein
MSQSELLKKVVDVLNSNGIPYMVTGSIVSSLQGEPRSTHDIDIVINIKKPDIGKLVQSFSMPDYYLDEDSIQDAITNQFMFNLIAVKEGDKVDFWILTNEDFDTTRFQRRVSEDLFGAPMYISSPEDTILAKLRWAKLMGGSEKQFGDALNVYEVQYEKLDLEYLELWVKRLEVSDLWGRLKDEGKVI